MSTSKLIITITRKCSIRLRAFTDEASSEGKNVSTMFLSNNLFELLTLKFLVKFVWKHPANTYYITRPAICVRLLT